MDDRQIIELYNKRDERAIEETDAKYGAYCFSIANNILLNVQDSEECVNDTWIKTWNVIPPEAPRYLKAFLAKITRNLSLNRYKERNREKRGGGDIPLALTEAEEFLSGSVDVATQAEEKLFCELLNRFLYSLPRRDRDIFILRYFYMESTATIAREQAIKESNVLTILSRTRKKLRALLEKEGYIL